MGIDYNFYKLKKGIKKPTLIFPYDSMDEGGEDDYDEIAYFSHGQYISELMDAVNSKAWNEYDESKQSIFRQFQQYPICIDDVRRAIDKLEELNKRVIGMPYDKSVDFPNPNETYDNLRNLYCLESEFDAKFKELQDTLGVKRDDIVSEYTYNDKKSATYVYAKTENMKNIIKEVYKIYGGREYHFGYPWEFDEEHGDNRHWKYANTQIDELKKIEKAFLDEPYAKIFMTWG